MIAVDTPQRTGTRHIMTTCTTSSSPITNARTRRRRRLASSQLPILIICSTILKGGGGGGGGVSAVGLRGVLWRQHKQEQDLPQRNTASPIDETAAMFHQPLLLVQQQQQQEIGLHALSCETDFGSEEHCPTRSSSSSSSGSRSTIPQTPICEYDEQTQKYLTVCLDTNSTGIALLYNPHPKSYCGSCHKCFETTEELRQAVHTYESYKIVDTELSDKYGWPIGNWCVDPLTDLSKVFFRKSRFNEDISKWDTSRVTNMEATFQNAFDFNQPLNSWDTSQVQTMERMFAMAIRFNQPLDHWDVSNVTAFGYQFLHAVDFNQDISSWNVHNAEGFNSMFLGATNFHQDLSMWQINEHADTDNMCQWSQAY